AGCGELGGGREEMGGLLVFPGGLQQLFRGIVVASGERGLCGGDQQVMLAQTRILVASLAESAPQPGGLVEARLLFVQRRERAHVRAAMTRGAAQLAIVGQVVAPDQDAGGERAESDEQ